MTVDCVHIVTNMQTMNRKQKVAAKEPRALEQVIVASVESRYKRHGKNPSDWAETIGPREDGNQIEAPKARRRNNTANNELNEVPVHAERYNEMLRVRFASTSWTVTSEQHVWPYRVKPYGNRPAGTLWTKNITKHEACRTQLLAHDSNSKSTTTAAQSHWHKNFAELNFWMHQSAAAAMSLPEKNVEHEHGWIETIRTHTRQTIPAWLAPFAQYNKMKLVHTQSWNLSDV